MCECCKRSSEVENNAEITKNSLLLKKYIKGEEK